jgi:mannose-6-phosphate isomerase-like protein (cupin superfamily)
MRIKKYNSILDTKIMRQDHRDLYTYTVYTGGHRVPKNPNQSVWWIDGSMVRSQTNYDGVWSPEMAVTIDGYTPWARTSEINHWATLPYIDGCATTQLLPPIRNGDPTWQMLYMHPYSSEQAHHIHSTARIVYVHSGYGECIYGTPENEQTMTLEPGDVLILDKMQPHHFITYENPLVALPLHVWSSVGKEEFNHPMFNGTHEV